VWEAVQYYDSIKSDIEGGLHWDEFPGEVPGKCVLNERIMRELVNEQSDVNNSYIIG